MRAESERLAIRTLDELVIMSDPRVTRLRLLGTKGGTILQILDFAGQVGFASRRYAVITGLRVVGRLGTCNTPDLCVSLKFSMRC